ncbi:hypothetical protein [Oceanibacterium hippocampi]|uniref:Uncharacterized protein n=1 Tax=Oceanibacterium hippocampi TaxID=745714 RepID=A0A1Y5U443_9PROT|nr:hypothetical protein [Oceanibacterium hippocampi]SLN76818.1 hypothetical protein OCH7691_04195 [Oceanibacterium hippocampi]
MISESPERLIQEFQHRLDSAGASLELEQSVDLSDLDGLAAALHDSIATLPEDERRPYRQRIGSLYTALDSLASALETRAHSLAERLEAINPPTR